MNQVLELVSRGFHDISELFKSYDFYKIRINKINEIKDKFPEPYKTFIINILANGNPVLSGTVPDIIEISPLIESSCIGMDTDAYFGKELSVYPKLNIAPEMEGWMCDCGQIPSINPDWRWNGVCWQHNHKYPIGHVLAKKIEKCCGNYPMVTKSDTTVKLWCSSCFRSTDLYYFIDNSNGIGNMIKEWNSFQKKQEAK